jgi:hypothetical protein
METAQLLLFTMLLCLGSTPPSAYSQDTPSIGNPSIGNPSIGRIWSISDVFNEAQRLQHLKKFDTATVAASNPVYVGMMYHVICAIVLRSKNVVEMLPLYFQENMYQRSVP